MCSEFPVGVLRVPTASRRPLISSSTRHHWFLPMRTGYIATNDWFSAIRVSSLMVIRIRFSDLRLHWQRRGQGDIDRLGRIVNMVRSKTAYLPLADVCGGMIMISHIL